MQKPSRPSSCCRGRVRTCSDSSRPTVELPRGRMVCSVARPTTFRVYVIGLVMDPAMFDSIRQGFGNNIREGALGARVLPQQRRDDARRYVYAALHWCTNHYSEICDSARELMGAGVFQTPADVSVLSNVSTRDAFALGSSNPTPPRTLSPLPWATLSATGAGCFP